MEGERGMLQVQRVDGRLVVRHPSNIGRAVSSLNRASSGRAFQASPKLESLRRSGFALGSLWCGGASLGGSCSSGGCVPSLCGGGEFCLYPFLGADNLGLEVMRRVGFAFGRQGRVGLEEVVKVLMRSPKASERPSQRARFADGRAEGVGVGAP
jgi:hypothetical protein